MIGVDWLLFTGHGVTSVVDCEVRVLRVGWIGTGWDGLIEGKLFVVMGLGESEIF